MLFTLNMSAQFLSKSSNFIIKTLNTQKISYKIVIDYYGADTIIAENISGCDIKYGFDRSDICHTEIIEALNDVAVAVVDMIMDLDEKHYINMNGLYWHEEDYGIVQVIRRKNIFTYFY